MIKLHIPLLNTDSTDSTIYIIILATPRTSGASTSSGKGLTVRAILDAMQKQNETFTQQININTVRIDET